MLKVKPAETSDFDGIIEKNIALTHQQKLVPDLDELEDLESVIKLVDIIIIKAWQAGASDVHIDPSAEGVLIRYRIDGILHDVVRYKKELQPLLVTRIKVLAGLRTDEHFAAQDGRFRLTVRGVQIDLRVSILTTYNGENVVMRLLVSDARSLTLEQLGFSTYDLKKFQQHIDKPHGMILATGPTGSGKTSTLYSIVEQINTREISVVTIEDPIEFAVPGITQIQVNNQTNLTFAAGLRSIVRQDPNTILVGEIRDSETAGIAVNAAMTGHRVLSTLHTTDAATTLPRLLDMGIEPFLIASTVNVAVGQRLVRRLCSKCKTQKALNDEAYASLANTLPKTALAKFKTFGYPRGCDACNQTGYSKRIGIFEVLEISEAVRKLIMRRANAEEIREAARQEGMITLLEDGIEKAGAGITSIAEILRVILD